MALTVFPTTGYDTFIALADADTYITANSLQSADWLALSDIDREVYLRIQTKNILYKIDETLLGTVVIQCLATATAIMAVNDFRNSLSTALDRNDGLITKEKVGVIEVNYQQHRLNRKVPTVYPKEVRSCLITYGASFPSSSQITLGKA